MTAARTPAAPRGRGRPALTQGRDAPTWTVRLTPEQLAKLARLGGAAWLRERIDKAKEPAA
jgi:hypothetical protein